MLNMQGTVMAKKQDKVCIGYITGREARALRLYVKNHDENYINSLKDSVRSLVRQTPEYKELLDSDE